MPTVKINPVSAQPRMDSIHNKDIAKVLQELFDLHVNPIQIIEALEKLK